MPLEATPQFQAASTWVSGLVAVFASKDPERWRRLVTQAENMGHSGISVLEADRRVVLEDLKHLLSLEQRSLHIAAYKGIIAADSASEHELIELFVALYLIALALALPISKTSADFFGRV